MGDMLSQAEIDALLNGTSLDVAGDADYDDEILTSQEIDALGEIGNICMGTSATTLSSLLGQKVIITTPQVSLGTLNDILKDYSESYVAVNVEYVNGLSGSNLLLIGEQDVKVITDLMMSGDGSKTDGLLTEFHLSAIGEAMNQMIGSAATSMSSMFDKRIEISPPSAFVFENENVIKNLETDQNEKIIKIGFKMVIGNLVDSVIMQILPISFAKRLVAELLNININEASESQNSTVSQPLADPKTQVQYMASNSSQPVNAQPQFQSDSHLYRMDLTGEQTAANERSAFKPGREPVNVQPAQFQSFDDNSVWQEKKNISMIMDVPLQVTVELGRTQKLIKDILGFGPGSIIELDKLAGEPVDILVNGKSIAKGEVVVIDESFGVRVTDIIHPSKRI